MKYKSKIINYNCPIYPLALVMYMMRDDFPKIFGRRYYSKSFVGFYQKDLNTFFVFDETPNKNAPYFAKKVMDRAFLVKVDKNIRSKSIKLLKFSNTFKNKSLAKLSDRELLKTYKDFNKKYSDLYVWGWLPLAVDGHKEYFSKQVVKEFKKFLKDKNKFADYFTSLTAWPETSDREKAEIELLKLAQNRSTKKESAYVKKYGWLSFNWWGPVYSKKDLKNDLATLGKDKESLSEKMRSLRNKQNIVEEKKQEIAKDISINKTLSRKIEVLAQLMYLKDYRKNILYQANYDLSFLMAAMAKYLKYPKHLLYYVLPEEMLDVFAKKISKKELERRYNFSALECTLESIKILNSKKTEELSEKLLKKVIKQKNVFPLRGQIASPGQAQGQVKIVNKAKDINKVKNGDILVSVKTDPTLLPAMKKAAAIVTEVGGITSHAAIVARELKVPCIIGVKNVNSILKEGQIIFVDANKGLIKKV